ncbi:Vacuolar protein-sorting-associated protein 28 [Puccinia graminis f. sp. tritici]|uniref:Vacuolar protein sorting-associated protein 28 n=1 Tax=Puccinia graminis f. sp. tritici TaxID=56615 RepID=A0A5B0P953_PUCGR|nr:Vacuolar protein-sorting-associated protein 28 [Puccinia graminis f. sp. tritici]
MRWARSESVLRSKEVPIPDDLFESLFSMISRIRYTPACGRLLGHFKTLLNLVGGDLQWIQNFMAEYRMDCQAAANRIRVGVPATVEHSSEEGNESSKASRGVAETTQNFITFMDALKLKMRAKDQLHPLLSELMVGYSKFPKSQEWEGRPKILHWLITLNSMRASDEITDEQSRQILFDIDSAYQEFYKSLT